MCEPVALRSCPLVCWYSQTHRVVQFGSLLVPFFWWRRTSSLPSSTASSSTSSPPSFRTTSCCQRLSWYARTSPPYCFDAGAMPRVLMAMCGCGCGRSSPSSACATSTTLAGERKAVRTMMQQLGVIRCLLLHLNSWVTLLLVVVGGAGAQSTLYKPLVEARACCVNHLVLLNRCASLALVPPRMPPPTRWLRCVEPC